MLGDGGLLLISVSYAVLALALTRRFLRQQQLAIPAGITAALAVVMVPMAIYASQRLWGLWPESGDDSRLSYRDYHRVIDWRWLMMELATLAAGVIALWRYRLPFLCMPVAVTLWYLGMDTMPFLLGGDGKSFFSDEGKRVCTAFGLAMVVVALWVDLRSRQSKDFAFWLYLFGVLSFWGGLTSMNSDSELGKLVYAGINLLLIAIGAALSRRVFAVFGALGVTLYLGHLSHTVFRDSMLFPIALAGLGLAIIAAGVYWQRHEAAIGQRLRALLPVVWRERLAKRSAV